MTSIKLAVHNTVGITSTTHRLTNMTHYTDITVLDKDGGELVITLFHEEGLDSLKFEVTI